MKKNDSFIDFIHPVSWYVRRPPEQQRIRQRNEGEHDSA